MRTILIGECEEKRPRGRPRHRCEDGLKETCGSLKETRVDNIQV
jgi:hypothetical protein